jgi:iron complex transport system ATP-binding protein
MAFRNQITLFQQYQSSHREQVKKIAVELNIQHLLDKYLNQLSGGEQQLCWLAQIFLQKPEVLLLDEPTQYLDVENRVLFFDFLTQYCISNQSIAICATHDLLFNKNKHRYYELIKKSYLRMISKSFF